MNVLLSLLQKSTDYNQLLKAVEAKQAVAVSGLSQAPRSHVLAAAHEQSGRPLIAVCQDDMAAKRLASELGAFLGEEPPVLPSRELTLAGAIGVSNIMMVTVKERTAEIGIRRAIGASPLTILSQILSESFILTFIAGIFGFGAGVGVLSIADSFYARAAQMDQHLPDISWQISFGMGMLALGILVLGSLLAGIIPATRALRIKAVDAIREE